MHESEADTTVVGGSNPAGTPVSMSKEAWPGALSKLLLREVGVPAAVGGVGYAASPYIAEKADITSQAGQQAHRLGTAASFAALASPTARRALFTKPKGVKSLKSLPDNKVLTSQAVKDLAKQRTVRPIGAPLSAASVLGGPTTLAAYTDPAKRGIELLDRAATESPEKFSPEYWSGILGEKIMRRMFGDEYNPNDSIMESKPVQEAFWRLLLGGNYNPDKSLLDYVRETSIPNLPNYLGAGAGMVGGSALGYGTGSLLGRLLLPSENADYANLDEKGYLARRRRERLRTLLKGVGLYGGSLAGGILGKKYLPGLIGNLQNEKSAMHTDTEKEAYAQGVMSKLAEEGVDPVELYPDFDRQLAAIWQGLEEGVDPAESNPDFDRQLAAIWQALEESVDPGNLQKEKSEMYTDAEKEAYAQGVMSKLAQDASIQLQYEGNPVMPAALIGALLGAIRSRTHRGAGAGHGALRGAGAGLGALVGAPVGGLAGLTLAQAAGAGSGLRGVGLGTALGATLGGVGGYHGAKGIFGKSPSEEAEEEEKEAYAQGVMSKLADYGVDFETDLWQKGAAGKPGLWANIHAKRKRGEKPAKPGDEDYPDAKSWKKTTNESKKKTKK